MMPHTTQMGMQTKLPPISSIYSHPTQLTSHAHVMRCHSSTAVQKRTNLDLHVGRLTWLPCVLLRVMGGVCRVVWGRIWQLMLKPLWSSAYLTARLVFLFALSDCHFNDPRGFVAVWCFGGLVVRGYYEYVCECARSVLLCFCSKHAAIV